MEDLSREEKMERFIKVLYDRWQQEVSDTITLASIDEGLCKVIPPYQQSDLLSILCKKYNCLTYEQERLWETRDKITEKNINFFTYGNDEFDREEIINELLSQRLYDITFKDNFPEVYSKITHKAKVFKLSLSDSAHPVLYINETPIRKFQSSDSYPCKIMRLALGLPNGSIVPVKDVLKTNRGDRGCPQDLADIFKSPVIKAVFAREITNSSFKIYHEVAGENLSDVPYFQNRSEAEESNTEYFAKMIEECRIAP